MTKDEIFKLRSGSQMDFAVATLVMSWHMIPPEIDKDGLEWRLMWLDKDNKFMHNDWHPSTDMNDAWEVVLYFADLGYAPNLIYDDDSHWALSFSGIQDVLPCTSVQAWIDYPELWCTTAPMAICCGTLINISERGEKNA